MTEFYVLLPALGEEWQKIDTQLFCDYVDQLHGDITDLNGVKLAVVKTKRQPPTSLSTSPPPSIVTTEEVEALMSNLSTPLTIAQDAVVEQSDYGWTKDSVAEAIRDGSIPLTQELIDLCEFHQPADPRSSEDRRADAETDAERADREASEDQDDTHFF